MRSLSSIPRRWLAAAVVFAAATILDTFVWLYYAGWSASVSIGTEWKLAYTPYVEIERVSPNGPADKAELRVGEKLLRVNGYPQHVISMAPAFAHENIALAEGMAEPLEAERRARQEMDIARQVQSKLPPQKAPVLKTIEYAGASIQARGGAAITNLEFLYSGDDGVTFMNPVTLRTS